MGNLDWIIRIWQLVQQWVIIAILVWWLPKLIKKVLPFLRHDSAANLERKIFSFDEAYLPKVITNDKGLISNVNKAAEKLFGWKETELIGRSYEVLIPEKDRAAFNEKINTENTEKEEDDQPDEENMSMTNALTKNKIEVPVEVVFRKKKLSSGEVVYMVIIHDRTKEVIKSKKFEQYIEILKIKLDILSRGEELSDSGSWLWDLKSKEITPSENYKRIIGLPPTIRRYTVEEIKPRVWEYDKHIVNEALEEAFKGNNYDIKFRMIRATDFKVIHISSKVQVFSDADGVAVALYGSTRLLKTEPLSDASRAEEDKIKTNDTI